MNLHTEWQQRSRLLDEILDFLSDGRTYSSREIASELRNRGFDVKKKLVNSILFSEGRRYVLYNKQDYTYCLGYVLLESACQKKSVSNETPSPDLNVTSSQKQRRYEFSSAAIDSPALFVPEIRGGLVQIVLNSTHPQFSSLMTVLTDEKSRVASHLIQRLLTAWADLEDEQPPGKRKTRIQDTRLDWGRKLRDLTSHA